MSFISMDKTHLARDLWPAGIGKPVKDADDITTLPSSRVVPGDYADLCQWLCVDSSDEEGHVKVFVNPDACAGEHGLLEVTLRIQGFIVDANLNALGNWRGDIQSAPKAVQSLRLDSGGFGNAFLPQVQALRNIRELVLKLLCKQSSTTGGGNGDIVLKRRVFQKVRPGVTGTSTLRVQDDPTGRAAKIEHMWRVCHRIGAGVQEEDGTMSRANALVIRRGDFVDVAVGIQVHSMRAHKQRKTEVHFCPLEVVRLRSAREVKMLIAVGAKPMKPVTAIKEVRRDTGFAFAEATTQVSEMQTD
ncbi:hypothetical protein BN946_scf184768.g5 [Trametes cinnabarina]|uniref:Uncharacterized protein n=1 Tax=Pycnoporus cinnabarinus TaxID=5643 RepID=A0A060STX5_PYCCI|nr:hypothetical protein BN946_scf184768.g5 [Trametes cinnabarina]